jgi:putative ABC transport system permease protein
MKLHQTAALALRALARNKMRSLLTTLGVVIGVAAVTMMQAIGQGATARVTDEIAGLGSNMLIVVPGAAGQGPFGGGMRGAPLFVMDDLEAIRREVAAVRHIAGVSSRSLRAVVGENNRSTTLSGVTPEFFAVRGWDVERGRLLNDDDERQAQKVCVIGHTIAAELFGGQEPIGAELRLHELGCRVVGLMEAKGVSTFGQDQDDFVLMPHTTYARRIAGDDHVGVLMVSAVSEARTDEARAQIEGLMRQRRRIRAGEDDDFNVRDLREIQALLGSVTGVLTTLLASVAAISLVVGGIGIMNIMLVSVTERTREIGVRRAIGARARDILRQFLVEAVVLSGVGGAVGVVVGTAGAYGLSRAIAVPFVFPLGGAALALAVSFAVGVLFGVFPARKASRLRPIEALRYE